MNSIRSVASLNVARKRVLLRVDFNVTLKKDKIADDTRIRQSIPTLVSLLKRGAAVILVTHVGRPNGKRVMKYSVRPVAGRLEKLIGIPVRVIDDFTKQSDRKTIFKLSPGEVVLLENIRFYPQEEQNDKRFSKQLSELAHVYVNDAFGTGHRAHSSTVGVAQYLEHAAGLLLTKEILMVRRLMSKPKRPFVAIIGGAKAETKITLIDRLLEMTDHLLIGGGVANTFFKAWGFETGKSMIDHEMVEIARSLIWKASRSRTALLLPEDVVVGNVLKNRILKVVPNHGISKSARAVDIGPRTQANFGTIISDAKTLVWNGPMGVYEKSKFRIGTDFIYHAIAANRRAFSVVGGGDTIAAITHKHLVGEIDHISTGGGALLQCIEKGTLPAIEALKGRVQ